MMYRVQICKTPQEMEEICNMMNEKGYDLFMFQSNNRPSSGFNQYFYDMVFKKMKFFVDKDFPL